MLFLFFQADTTIEEAFNSIVNECKVKEQASDADAVVVVNHDVPNSSTEKCLFACFYETIGVVSVAKNYFQNKVKIHDIQNLYKVPHLILKNYEMLKKYFIVPRLEMAKCPLTP